MKFILFLLLACAFPVWAQTFLPGTEDIPLMEGLTHVEETAAFDNPAERMVLINAQTTLSAKQVERFYEQTLANLGWQQIKRNVYKRGNDSFSMEISGASSVTQIQFQLSQRNP